MKEVVKTPEWKTAEYHRNEIVNIINLLDKIDSEKFLRRTYVSLREHVREEVD